MMYNIISISTPKTERTYVSQPKFWREDPEHVIPRLRIESDGEYARAIQALVVVCTDVAIIDSPSKTIYLAKRASRPAHDRWWYIGGRCFPGETEYESMQRCFKRETGLLIEQSRFVFRCMNRYTFKDRQQEPVEIGCDSLCYTFTVELSADERELITLDQHEYAAGGLHAFTHADLPHIEKEDDNIKTVSALYAQVFPQTFG